MRIHIATDHAGLDFSRDLQAHLRAAGHEVVDHGPTGYDPLDDYPSFCIDAALATAADLAAGVEALGIVFGGSGNGCACIGSSSDITGGGLPCVAQPVTASRTSGKADRRKDAFMAWLLRTRPARGSTTGR